MEYFKWDLSLDVQISQMNDEHKTLIDHMNKLHKCYQEQKPAAETSAAFDALYNYTKKHFADEEAYLASQHYPAYETHKRLHDDLLQKLDNYKKLFSETGQINNHFFAFLKSWLTSHIKVVDSQYGEYIVRNTKKAG